MEFKRPANLDDLASLLNDLTEQIKVLVSATDDLRCEIEWWARNALEHDAKCRSASQESNTGDKAEVNGFDVKRGSEAELRLAMVERALTRGRRTEWSKEWDGLDAPELPHGKVVCLDGALWEAILDLRPAHVVDAGCDCEDGIGAPYLMAWQSDQGFFLRELKNEEAYRLQRACLSERSEGDKAPPDSDESREQLGLW